MTKFDPQEAQNLVEIEKQFAVVAVEYAQTHWNLLSTVQPRELRLTRSDDEIFEHLLKDFPEFAEPPHSKLLNLDEDWMKSENGKARWRNFVNQYEKKVKDFNFGSLVRSDAKDEYSQHNSIFVTRMQFYGIEIARNRLGLNDLIHEKAKKENQKAKETEAKGGGDKKQKKL